MNDLEAQLEESFKDWMGWNDRPPPEQDDPDYYTYTWGLTVWVNSAKEMITIMNKNHEANRV